jgi:hypothetical protein
MAMDKDSNQDPPNHDLASKVDALLHKHASSASLAPGHDDRNIPVLNDIIDAPEWSPPAGRHSSFADASGPPPIPLIPLDILPTATGPSVLSSMTESEIDQLSHDIFTRVFDRLDGELGVRLEEQLADRLATQINAVVTQVYSDLKQDLANEIGDAINAAIADKLRRS